MAACERGAEPLQLLRDYLGENRADPLQEFVFRRTGPLHPPSYTESGWEAFIQLCRDELFGVSAD